MKPEDPNNNQEFDSNNEELESEEISQDDTGSDLVLITEIFPDKLMVLPVYDRPIFPGLLAPLTFTGKAAIDAITATFNTSDRLVGVALAKTEEKEEQSNPELYPVGTILKLYKLNRIAENIIQVFAQGLGRFSYVRTVRQSPFLKWEVKYHYTPPGKPDEELKAYTLSIISLVKELLKKNPIFQEQLKMVITQISYDKPGILMDLIASMLTAESSKLQELLEAFDLYKRSEKLLILLREEIELSELQQKIQNQIQEKITQHQKEFFLREQLKVIKKELGLEKDEKSSEIEKIEIRIKDLSLTKEAAEVIHEELDKLKILEPASSEFHVTRTYLNTLTELPWGIFTQDRMDIKEARRILDKDHYGLEDVKRAILEFISTLIKRGKLSGSIICLVGPPGVGKTSIGRSIAEALNRKFYRFSLGGMRDEAEIKGHRRTYIGAMPGKIIQSLKRTGSSNPVIMLDEIDKIGSSYQGDPASALLEVLDPEQNRDFLDHYLDVRFDLSNIMFITTANQLDTIPQPLLDRMEVIKLAGYIREEKVQIAKRYLIPRQMELHGLIPKDVKITDKALLQIVENYAREAGVRNLENQIKKIMRQVTLQQAEGKAGQCSISANNLEKYLGKPIFIAEELYEKEIPGICLGLAWTSMGGATLYIEASAIKGNSGFKQTGQLGKVMQESSEIAYSYARALIANDGEISDFFNKNYIHLHVPAGATPKDGPSAGITMALALYSLATNKPVKKGLAMTGELTLTGKVLPIGGVREKTLAARRVGVIELIFPKDNRKDFEELPDYLKEGIKVHYADYFEDILKVVYPEKSRR